ncbi:hypothetical protein K1719_047399 [Acacia pycnantha]|nr:hypothetical protein K1719_047399 [Acacia pycnantha]
MARGAAIWEIGAVPGRPAARLAFISVPWRTGARGFGCRGRPRARLRPPPPYRRCSFQPVRGSLFLRGHDNDPSAGSPTETLLRLLLPLNDKVQWTSRDVAGGEPPTSPRSEHFTGPFNRINRVAFLGDAAPRPRAAGAVGGRERTSCTTSELLLGPGRESSPTAFGGSSIARPRGPRGQEARLGAGVLRCPPRPLAPVQHR